MMELLQSEHGMGSTRNIVMDVNICCAQHMALIMRR
jgi:hypothetical protein